MEENVKECENCGCHFIAKRSTARFCSAACRQQNHKKKRGEPSSLYEIKENAYKDGYRACYRDFCKKTEQHPVNIRVKLLEGEFLTLEIAQEKLSFFAKIRRCFRKK